MTDLPISDIKVGVRYRTSYNGISELAASIKTHGLIQPLVLDRQNNLIAGGRRYRACQEAGLTTVKVVYRDEADELTRRELELEENLHREDLTWVEVANCTAEIDRLKREKYGDGAVAFQSTDGSVGWDVYDTATALNSSQPTVSRNLAAARVLELFPELADEPDRASALAKFDKFLERAERELAVRDGGLKDDNIYHGDFRTLHTKIPDESVDLILFDPPYGTSLDKLNQGVEHTDTHFDDSVKSAILLLKDVLPIFQRVLKPDGHIYCFCGLKVVDIGIARQPLYAVFADLFAKNGFAPDYIPLVWTKSTSGLVEFDYRYGFSWEPILFVSNREMRRLTYKRSNVFQFASVHHTEKVNLAQKPVELYKELITESTAFGEVVLDPMAGSGSSVRAARSAGRRYIAFEKDLDQYNAILRSLVEPEGETI